MTQPIPRRSNGLGIAGFVLSLLGIFSFGILAPIALLLCFFALFKRPRGLAFAGFIISFITTAFLATVIFIFGFLISSVVKFGKPMIVTVLNAQKAAENLNADAFINGGKPLDDISGNAKIVGIVDGWGRPYQYRRANDFSFELRSASKDGLFNTEDDYSQFFDVHPPR